MPLRMHIYNEVFETKSFFVESPTLVPRVGEEVNCGYNPPAVVQRVVYDFKTSNIVVVVK